MVTLSSGLKAVQGIFRSCPALRDALLTDDKGVRANFAVFPEVTTRAYELGSYYDFLPMTRVDREFITQVKPRWAALTSMANVKKESVVLYHPKPDGSIAELRGSAAAGVSNLGILRCALQNGSIARERLDPRLQPGLFDQGRMDKAAFALGYTESELSASWDEFVSQEAIGKYTDEFMQGIGAETDLWNSARHDARKCMSLYEMAHGTEDLRKQAQPYLAPDENPR